MENNNYGLYLAKVLGVSANSENDSRLKVRVVPHMNNMEATMCPLWPYFFKDSMLLATTDELVWVICSNDFSMGYILGSANYNTYMDQSYEKYSIQKDFLDNISNIYADLKGTMISFSNMKVLYWDSSSIHLIDRNTGGIITAYDNGTISIIRSDNILFKIGNSVLDINKNGISIKADKVSIQSDNVFLGNNPSSTSYVVVSGGGDGGKVSTISSSVRA